MKHYFDKTQTCCKVFILLCTVSMLCINSVVAQQFTVKGNVFDETTKAPIPGATVVQKGTNKATITDQKGNFALNLNSKDELEVSFIGYYKKAVQPSANASLNISLKEDAKMLDEVVVIGYGSMKKKDLTGAVSSVKIEDSPMANLPNVTIMEALKGTIAGFNVGVANSAGGDPGITIRGLNSIKASNTPLIIVDGIQFPGSMNELNPGDIASIDVLKDASAAAVYGARSANGVILITTKRGKSEVPTVRIRATGGFQSPTQLPDMYDPEQFLQFKKDVAIMKGSSGSDLDYKNLLTEYEYKAYQAGHTVDWYKEATRTAYFQDYEVSISGASDRTNYYLSGSFNSQPGIVVGDEYKRFSVFSKVESQITKWLKLGINLNIVSRNYDGNAADLRNATLLGPYSYTNSPLEGWGHVMERHPQGSTSTQNPLWQTQEDNYDRNQNYYGRAFARIDCPWIKGLSYTFNLGMNRWEQHKAVFKHEDMFVNTMAVGELNDKAKFLKDANGFRSNTDRYNYTMNHLVNYNQQFGKHNIDATFVAERQKTERRYLEFSAKDFSEAGSTVLGYNALEKGKATSRGGNTDFTRSAELGYLGRINYVYNNRYHISASYRVDGSSALSEGNKFDDFTSAAAAWTVTEENFMKGINKYLNYLKVRVSFGQNGNASVGSYSSFASIGSGNYIFGNETVSTIYPSNFANKSLKWEKTSSLNVGFDFGIFNDAVTGTFNYYNSNTTNLLFPRSLPIMNGFATVTDNMGKVNNKGVEIQVTSRNFARKDFTWTTTANFWLNRNKIVSLYGLDSDGDGREDDDITNNYFIGKPRDAIYTYVFDGIVQSDDAEYMKMSGASPGDIKFKDIDDSGTITEADRRIIGYRLPRFTATMSNTITYKNFSLYFMLNWTAGGGKDNYYLGENDFAGSPGTLMGGLTNWLNKEYWMPDRPSNTIPRPNYKNDIGYKFPAKRDFLRLQDISLSYTFSKDMLNKIYVENLRFFVSAKNLFTATKWEGVDPEYGNGIKYAQDGGGGYPVYKTISFGVEISF